MSVSRSTDPRSVSTTSVASSTTRQSPVLVPEDAAASIGHAHGLIGNRAVGHLAMRDETVRSIHPSAPADLLQRQPAPPAGADPVSMAPLDANERTTLDRFVREQSVFPNLASTALTRNFEHDAAVAGEYFFCNRNPSDPYDRFCVMTGSVQGLEPFCRFVNTVMMPAFGLLSADTWNRDVYGTWRTAMRGMSFDAFKSDLRSRLSTPPSGETRTMSSFAGTPRAPRIEQGELEQIYPDWARRDPAIKQRDLEKLNEAFVLMQLDTVQAQALYLAHAEGESGEFAQMVAQGDPPGLRPYIGRGPLQVTTKPNYVATLAYLQVRAEDFFAAGDIANATVIARAYYAVSQDINAAADPQLAFLFSAAFMRASLSALRDEQAVQSIPGIPGFGGRGTESRFMTGGAVDDPNAAKKRRAYTDALRVLGGSP